MNYFHLGFLICAKLRKAKLLLLRLLGGGNSTLLVSSINTLLTYLQVNSSLVFTSHDTIAFMIFLAGNNYPNSPHSQGV